MRREIWNSIGNDATWPGKIVDSKECFRARLRGMAANSHRII
jgi:hypothetical protein